MHFPSHWPFLVSPGWAAPAVSLEDLHQAENSDNRREKLRKANKRGIGGRGEKRCLRRRITCWVNGGIRVKGKCEKSVSAGNILTHFDWASDAPGLSGGACDHDHLRGHWPGHSVPGNVTRPGHGMRVKSDAVWCLRKWSLSLPNPLLSAANQKSSCLQLANEKQIQCIQVQLYFSHEECLILPGCLWPCLIKKCVRRSHDECEGRSHICVWHQVWQGTPRPRLITTRSLSSSSLL